MYKLLPSGFGGIRNKIHLISLGCPWPSIALQCRIVAQTSSFPAGFCPSRFPQIPIVLKIAHGEFRDSQVLVVVILRLVGMRWASYPKEVSGVLGHDSAQ